MSWSCRHCVPVHLIFDEIINTYNRLPMHLFTFIIPKMAESVGSMTNMEMS
jgi:hypothetical protein